jgi:hypothetical protein
VDVCAYTKGMLIIRNLIKRFKKYLISNFRKYPERLSHLQFFWKYPKNNFTMHSTYVTMMIIYCSFRWVICLCLITLLHYLMDYNNFLVISTNILLLIKFLHYKKKIRDPSWSYGRWIYTTCAISTNHHKVVSSIPANGEVYFIQHYVIKFVSDLRQVGGFLWVLRFPTLIKLTTTI